MAEVYPIETLPLTAEYQATLESFLVETAAAMDQQAQWLAWAARGGFASDTIARYNNQLLATAELNKQAVKSLIEWLGDQELSVWIGRAGQEPSPFIGLQYYIGDPSYQVGIMQHGERAYVPFNTAQHSIQIREPQTYSAAARLGGRSAATPGNTASNAFNKSVPPLYGALFSLYA